MPESELRSLLENLEKRLAALEKRLDKEDEDQWKRLDSLQDKMDSVTATMHIMNTAIVRVEAGLSERCVSRGEDIKTLRCQLTEINKKVWTLSGGAAVLAVLASWILKKL